ncbi:uncharacterized protein DAT39_008959 [Clarias magur]|uniref:Uncharacterized protein n=1 Tax=Clarias magur TaxID=1594786 RepID=A0A8J4U9K4_CLAMG|nr:uncharacterized protein DAT39_008959 [Clarias magur]
MFAVVSYGAFTAVGSIIAQIRSAREALYGRLLSGAESSDVITDVGIDASLLKHSGKKSAAELENSIIQVLKDKCRKIPGYVERLGTALAAFETVPNAVGLGAVAVCIGLELIIGDQDEDGESKDRTMDMMRRVFAEEKASGARDSMDEYLKRLGMYLHQPTRALEETGRLEKQLSEQLTRLKNSMLHDDQMSSRSLKHWTNGAAFHLQMLIHAARLKTQSSTEHQEELQVHVASIESVLNLYQFDLEELLKQYKTYKTSTISLSHPDPWLVVASISPPVSLILQHLWIVKDKELNRETGSIYDPLLMTINSDYFVDYMFENWALLKNLKSYFSNLKENLEALILQNDEFNLQKVLPVSDEQGA